MVLAMRSSWDLQAARRVLLRQLDQRAAQLVVQQEELREQRGKLADLQGGCGCCSSCGGGITDGRRARLCA